MLGNPITQRAWKYRPTGAGNRRIPHLGVVDRRTALGKETYASQTQVTWNQKRNEAFGYGRMCLLQIGKRD